MSFVRSWHADRDLLPHVCSYTLLHHQLSCWVFTSFIHSSFKSNTKHIWPHMRVQSKLWGKTSSSMTTSQNVKTEDYQCPPEQPHSAWEACNILASGYYIFVMDEQIWCGSTTCVYTLIEARVRMAEPEQTQVQSSQHPPDYKMDKERFGQIKLKGQELCRMDHFDNATKVRNPFYICAYNGWKSSKAKESK